MTHINRILLLCFLLFYSVSFSQETSNPFGLSEVETYENSNRNDNQFASADYETGSDSQSLTNGTGPPGGDDDSVPIDSNIIILIVAGFLIIGYVHFRRKFAEI